jgi:SAM-dependent methyltransferase
MPIQDAVRWNERYGDEGYPSSSDPRAFLVDHAHLLPPGGLVLDAAMGLGGNAAFLLDRGFRVVGVDIAETALRRAKSRLPELMAVTADLTEFYLPRERFDVILNFYYLQRDLWDIYRHTLKKGGILFVETLTREMLSICPDIDPAYLLEEDELRRAFVDWEVLVYREGWEESRGGHRRAIASLVARLP